MNRPRLRSAQRRQVTEAAETAFAAVAPLVEAMLPRLLDRVTDVPAELRLEAFSEAMNLIGRDLFTGAELALLLRSEES